MNRARLTLVLQLAVSVVLLAVLVRQVSLRDAGAAFRRVRPLTLIVAVALVMVGYVGRAQRWSMLLRRCGISLSSAASYRLTLVGTFYGMFTPGRVGEFARALHVRGPRTAMLASVVWDRVADVLILEALCVPAFALVPAWRGPLLWAYLALVAFTLVGVVVLGNPAASRLAGRLLPFLSGPASCWSDSSQSLLRGGASLASFAWGGFFYVFMYTSAWLLLRDLAPHTSPRLLLGLPVIPLLGNLPVALGGLGLREQVSAAVFRQFGADATTGAVFSLLLFSVSTLVPGLLGLVLAATPWARAAAGEGKAA
jgi:uncharacterized membrane protein YbhN (UPF0104 family)